jgi:hypothetical protein
VQFEDDASSEVVDVAHETAMPLRDPRNVSNVSLAWPMMDLR